MKGSIGSTYASVIPPPMSAMTNAAKTMLIVTPPKWETTTDAAPNPTAQPSIVWPELIATISG